MDKGLLLEDGTVSLGDPGTITCGYSSHLTTGLINVRNYDNEIKEINDRLDDLESKILTSISEKGYSSITGDYVWVNNNVVHILDRKADYFYGMGLNDSSNGLSVNKYLYENIDYDADLQDWINQEKEIYKNYKL